MDTLASNVAFVFALLAVGAMGFAIQRGATCTVAAVDELVARRSARRLSAMLEASLWVAGSLVLADLAGALPSPPAAYAASGWTVAGGALLGFGAWVNRACVFGAIARFGSGEWAYALTPAGYLVGCWSVAPLFAPTAPERLAEPSLVLAATPLLASPVVAFALWRAWSTWRGWTPQVATTAIGITFVLSWLLAGGAWPYTELLADLARGMADDVAARVLLFIALWAGAAVGGWRAGRWRPAPVGAAQALRCFAGGVLMAWGTLLIPGANDGLILVGMPLLRPYAWLAFATMCVAIGTAIVVRNALARPLASQPQ